MMWFERLQRLLFNRWFLIILVIKVVVGTLLASDYMVRGFIPFINYFVTSWFDNPYRFFLHAGYPEAFPYPVAMLLLFGAVRFVFSFFLSSDWSVVGLGHVFMMRLPILAADIFLYVILCKWLETKERKVLWLYWASPILFFINYIHGQLDVIPTTLLFISLVFLFNKKTAWAMITLGIGLATKTHLLVVLPFYFIYLGIHRYRWNERLFYVIVPLIVFILFIGPYLFYEGLPETVFRTAESGKAFLVHLPYIHNNLRLLLAPAAILILVFNFAPYKKLNKDAMLLILGLLFTVFIAFVPPMPGWFYWSIPFFVYFFAKYQETPKFSFWCMNLTYLLYVVISEDSSFFSSFQLVWPELLHYGSMNSVLAGGGLPMSLIEDGIFTVLIAAVVMNAVWIYRMGVRSNLEYKVTDKPLVIGIGGDSGSGKNTTAELLKKLFHPLRTMIIEGDDAHKWERHDEHWKVATHLDPRSNRLHQELEQAHTLRSGQAVQRQLYDHKTGTFTVPSDVEPNKIILYVGLHPFYLSQMRRMFDIKIYLKPDEQLRRHWKVLRDSTTRGRDKAEVVRQIEARQADADKYIHPQRNFADIIINIFLTTALVDDQEPQLGLRITCDNSIHLDPLMEALVTGRHTLKVEHWYEDDLHRQTIEFRGSVTAEQISVIAHGLLPNLDELIEQSPDWQADYDGVRQLFIIYYYSEMQKTARS